MPPMTRGVSTPNISVMRVLIIVARPPWPLCLCLGKFWKMTLLELTAQLRGYFDGASRVEVERKRDVVVEQDQLAAGLVEDPASRVAHLGVQADLGADRADDVAGPRLAHAHI